MAAFRVGGLVGFGFGPSGVRWVVWAFGNFGFGRLELVTHPDNGIFYFYIIFYSIYQKYMSLYFFCKKVTQPPVRLAVRSYRRMNRR